jgi:hypothetical protein
MRHRPFRVALLLFVVAWFGVIVPGHRRGQIALPGWTKTCCSIPAAHCDGSRPDSPPQPAACAVCHFLAMLDLPTPVQLDVPSLTFLRPSAYLPQASLFSAEVRPTCSERAPPVA